MAGHHEETWEAPGAKKGLYAQRWEPAGTPRAVVHLLHGLGEHSGRYGHLAARFTAAGFAMTAFDLRGHGRSDGHQGDTRFAASLADVEDALAKGSERYPGTPAFLYGHSLGALLAVAYTAGHPQPLRGAVISALGVHSALREQRAKVRAARFLGRYTPRLRMKSGIDPETISRDPDVVAAYRADPLTHGIASMGFGADALDAVDRALAGPPNPEIPLLLIHGGEDRLAYASGARAFAQTAGAIVTLKVYDSVSHELHNEPEQAEVFADVLDWMEQRLG